MAGVNKVILIGHLGRDPELTYTPSGLAVARFSLATSERRKTAEGEWADHTEWHRIVVFGKTAENAGQYLTKGRQIYVEGRLQTRNWEKEGVQHYTTEVIGNNIQFLGKRDDYAPPRPAGESQYQPQSPAPASAPQPDPTPPPGEPGDAEMDEDLPF